MALTKVSSGLMKPDNNLELEYTSQLGTTSVVGAATGYVVRTNYYDASVTAGSGATFKFTGVTTLGKAGNVPDADGYFYDAVGKQFAVVGTPNVNQYGATGLVDDIAAIQIAVNFAVLNHAPLNFLDLTYPISAAIAVPATYGWTIRGQGTEATIIKQLTDNTPIFNLGASVVDYMHSYTLTDMAFEYANSQPATNTLANPIYFNAMGFQGKLDNLRFSNGHYGIRVKSGIGGPWGQDWDRLQFNGGLTGGAMDWTGAINAVPNNRWGRFIVTATNMAGPIFKNIRGYNWTWDTVEILNVTNAEFMFLQAGSELTLGAIKCEILTFTDRTGWSGISFITAPSAYLTIDQIHLGGTVCVLTPSANSFILTSSGVGYIRLGTVHVLPTLGVTNFALLNAGAASCPIIVGKVVQNANPAPYTNIASTASADYLTVNDDISGRISANKGDAAYTVTQGDPNIVIFETTLTAARDVALPVTNNFNGLYYTIISKGAVNGANTILIKASGILKTTLSADNTYAKFVWRRHPTPHGGWVLIETGAI